MNAREWYRSRAESWARRRDAERARSVVLSRSRLATFLVGAALLWWGLADVRSLAVAAGSGCLIAFAVLVVAHARVEERAAKADAAREVNARGLARIARDWRALPAAVVPAGLDVDRHAYAGDLDLFGRASLAQWLGVAATDAGASTITSWLLTPADGDAVGARQEAVRELAPRAEWREALATEGLVAFDPRAVGLERLLAWAESDTPALHLTAALRLAIPMLTASILIPFALQLAGVLHQPWWLVPMMPGIVISFICARGIHGTFDRVGMGQRRLQRHAAMLQHAIGETWSSRRLVLLQSALTAEGAAAPAAIRRLARILGFSELRAGAALFHFLIQAFTLWDFHVLFALERWRARNGARVRVWMGALGEIDALSVLSAVHHDNPEWAMPAIESSADSVVTTALGHPLIPDDRRVANDVEVGPTGTLLLITGSNMSGKSTLLRAIGLNVVLAQSGAPVCATAFRAPPSTLQTSIRVQDSLELGLSYFMAALARLKRVVDAAEVPDRDGRTLIYLLDEILQGTNSVERGIAVRAVARHLLDAGALGAMTTHDLALAAEEPLASAAKLVHFSESVEPDGTMTFDYRLRPGLATSRNALRLMQLIGIDPK